MKRVFIILLLWLPLLLNAQEKAAYRITYDCNALYNTTSKTYRWNLDIGSSTAVFYSPNYRKYNEAIRSIQNTDNIATAMNTIRQLGSRYPNRNSLQILVGAPEKNEYTYINKVGTDLFMYEESVPDTNWELTDSTVSTTLDMSFRSIATARLSGITDTVRSQGFFALIFICDAAVSSIALTGVGEQSSLRPERFSIVVDRIISTIPPACQAGPL